MNKHVLYLSYDGMTDPLGQSQVLAYIKELTDHGFTFHLISFEKKDRFEKDGEHIKNLCDKVGIKWHPLFYRKNPPVLSTLLDIASMKKEAQKILDQYPIAFIHCRSYISGLVALDIKQKTGIEFLFDMRGFWADERVDGKIWSLKNPIYKYIYNYFKKKEKQFFNESKHIISLTHKAVDEIKSFGLSNVNAEKISVIPCCVNTELFDTQSISNSLTLDIRRNLGLGVNDYIIGYVGSLGTWYMLPEMMQLYAQLRKAKGNTKFLFVTREDKENIYSAARKEGVPENEIIISSCMHHEVPAYMSLFNLSIFFILPAYSKMASSPVKQGELMAMGIPIICNAGVGDTDRIIEEGNAGIVLANTNQESFKNIHIPQFNTDNIKNYAKDKFSLKNGSLKYLIAYKKFF